MSNAASVRVRLFNVTKMRGSDFNQVLVRFALERILYCLTQSKYAGCFLLKGALLFTLWYDMPHRATHDADMLGFGASDLESIAQVFREITAIAVDDGIVFNPASVTVEEIRKEAGYGGVCVVIAGELARTRQDTDRRRLRRCRHARPDGGLGLPGAICAKIAQANQQPAGIPMNERFDEILTIEEVAVYLKVGRRTVYRLAANGQIPACKLDGTWRFLRTELDRWIASRISTQGQSRLDKEKP
jgi:excisionase family DNA binding protein